MAIARDVTDLIGSTPLIALSRFGSAYNVNATLLAKLEGMNPAGSAKDRVAAAMIAAAGYFEYLKENFADSSLNASAYDSVN